MLIQIESVTAGTFRYLNGKELKKKYRPGYLWIPEETRNSHFA